MHTLRSYRVTFSIQPEKLALLEKRSRNPNRNARREMTFDAYCERDKEELVKCRDKNLHLPWEEFHQTFYPFLSIRDLKFIYGVCTCPLKVAVHAAVRELNERRYGPYAANFNERRIIYESSAAPEDDLPCPESISASDSNQVLQSTIETPRIPCRDILKHGDSQLSHVSIPENNEELDNSGSSASRHDSQRQSANATPGHFSNCLPSSNSVRAASSVLSLAVPGQEENAITQIISPEAYKRDDSKEIKISTYDLVERLSTGWAAKNNNGAVRQRCEEVRSEARMSLALSLVSKMADDARRDLEAAGHKLQRAEDVEASAQKALAERDANIMVLHDEINGLKEQLEDSEECNRQLKEANVSMREKLSSIQAVFTR
ncbi:hypothetical protein BGW36DRAFT_362811 [Talaromyces proteolyticus]|uniref:Uncharacterized protein n=1 Tax=Talaromyces proteolyticus TaxID=1131652 RepID=A0AAD4KK95_9EURO|nr:uncharacterized protein BGW36DRAFT_362811 [Talaromyces proteolyticus]KAH8693290.1 hypothetical protein BGW36DRAFT_362811 [Talaromyces proteolyticus]